MNDEKIILIAIVVDNRTQRIYFPFTINNELDLQQESKLLVGKNTTIVRFLD